MLAISQLMVDKQQEVVPTAAGHRTSEPGAYGSLVSFIGGLLCLPFVAELAIRRVVKVSG